MKSSIKSLVIDSDINYANDIKKYFSSHEVIDVVETFDNGKKALQYIIDNKHNIDVIIMDLLLPEIDGIELLSTLKNNYINKKIIVLSSFKDSYVISEAEKYNISYYMLKPCSFASLEKRLLSLNEKKDNTSVEDKINNLLHELGMPSHIRGFQFIRDAVIMIYSNPNDLIGITKEVYPELAIRYNTTPSRVERAIRHAIEVCWMRGDLRAMSNFFGNSVDINKDKPSNSQFIHTMLDVIKYKSTILSV